MPEEIAPYINDPKVKQRMLIVPRTLDSRSVAHIIQVAVKIQTAKEQTGRKIKLISTN